MDSIISSSNSGVIKLEGQRNWIVWKFQITVLLKGLGIFSIVDGTTTKPEEEVQAQDWIKKDGSAQSLIVTRLTESTMAHIVTCETAADMWRKLLSICEQKSESSIHLVQQRFFSYQYEEGMEISVFVSKVQELASQLKSLGEKVYDNFIMTKILMSLPEKFKYFMSA
ncbi:GSCOCG00010914001-RA-CDS, partial [Cotesia congregata]